MTRMQNVPNDLVRILPRLHVSEMIIYVPYGAHLSADSYLSLLSFYISPREIFARLPVDYISLLKIQPNSYIHTH